MLVTAACNPSLPPVSAQTTVAQISRWSESDSTRFNCYPSNSSYLQFLLTLHVIQPDKHMEALPCLGSRARSQGYGRRRQMYLPPGRSEASGGRQPGTETVPGEGALFRGLHMDPGVRTWLPVLSGSAWPPATCGSSQGVCFLPGSQLWNTGWLRSILNKRNSKNDDTTSLGARQLQGWVLRRPRLTSLALGSRGSQSAQTLGCCD